MLQMSWAASSVLSMQGPGTRNTRHEDRSLHHYMKRMRCTRVNRAEGSSQAGVGGIQGRIGEQGCLLYNVHRTLK